VNGDSDTAARARALLDAATPGPWTVTDEVGIHWPADVYVTGNGDTLFQTLVPHHGNDRNDEAEGYANANAGLIAAAPTLITDLLAEVDGLRAALDTPTAIYAEMLNFVGAERDAAVARADELEAAMLEMAPLDRGTDRQRDDDRHPLTRFMKARSNEWGTDR
jgi:hypothetical protein